MRDYAKVSPRFWLGETGRELRKAGAEAQVVAFYLMTSPHANMLGLYYLPVLYLAHETGLGLEGASKGLKRAVEAGFCSYDHDAEMVWVHEMAAWQVGETLKPGDNRCAGVRNEYASLPENAFLSAFYDRYKTDFHLDVRRNNSRNSVRGFEGAFKGLRSQEQEQEKEQEKEQEQDKNTIIVRKEKLCGGCTPECFDEGQNISIKDFLDSLSPAQQHEATVYLNLLWAQKEGVKTSG